MDFRDDLWVVEPAHDIDDDALQVVGVDSELGPRDIVVLPKS